MTADPKIVDRMKKLHAMAQSAQKIGSEEEAQAFATKLQELLAQHRMSLSGIEYKEQQQEPIVDVYWHGYMNGFKLKRKTLDDWALIMGNEVGGGSACVFILCTGMNSCIFRGRKADADNAAQTFSYLFSVADRIAEREYVRFFHECRKAGDVTKAQGYKRSFLLGFVRRLKDRLAEARVKLESGAAGTGLMRISQDLARAKASLKDDKNIKNVKKASAQPTNAQGLKDGHDTANKQRLGHGGELSS